jgi:hypothetical protein
VAFRLSGDIFHDKQISLEISVMLTLGGYFPLDPADFTLWECVGDGVSEDDGE